MEFVKYIPGILLTLIVVSFVVWRWVEGVDFMTKNHSDYKGNDFFGLEEEDLN